MPKLIAFIPQVLLVTILFTACSIKDPAEVLVLPVSPVSLDRAEGPSHKFMAQKERYEREVEMTRDPLLGYVPVERLMVAEQRAKTMQARMMDAPAFTWTERGPANMAGRTRTVLIDAGDPSNNTVFAGSVSGGLWKTSNFKTSTPEWTPVIAVSANLAITTMAQHPGNPLIMYAGTGEGFNNIDAVRGLGIYKTIDGGLTWTLLPSTTTGGANRNDFSFVQEVLVYPNGDVYASGISASFCNNGGVLRSTNGGASWTRVIGLYTGGGTCNNAFDFAGYDIAMSKDGDLYATVIDNGFSYTAPATTDTTIGKIYRSPAGLNVGNAGNWVNVTPPPLSAHGSYWRRIAIACSPTNNNRIYALLQGTGTAIGGIRVSHDAGASWTSIDNFSSWCDQGSMSSSDFSRGQAWYDLCIAVKPDDDQTVYAGGVDVVKTADGGLTWQQNTQWAGGCGALPLIHADIHNFYFFPNAPGEMIVVNDGGIYYSPDNGVSYIDKNAGYNTVQYYSGAIHPAAASSYMLGGSQDNGTHRFTLTGLGAAAQVLGGDGGFCFIDQDDPSIQIGSYTNCYFEVSRDGGVQFDQHAYYGSDGRFINPAAYDDVANLLFMGYSGGHLLRIKNITSGTLSADQFNIPAAGTRLVSAIKSDPDNPNRLWVAFSGGVTPVLVKLTNTHTVPVVTSVSLPASLSAGHYISAIDIEPGNADHIVLSVSNYGVASVYESVNGGSSWTALDNNGVNLPDMPVRWVMFAPGGQIMLATELGVWTATTTSGLSTTWTQSPGLPNVRVDMMSYRTSDQTILAATHGRGLFTTVPAAALPVTLSLFKGQLQPGHILLHWATDMEMNAKDYVVEKSTDGREYYRIGIVAAAGNSNEKTEYQLKDLHVLPVNYYRLRMRDRDGKEELSKVVLIRSALHKQNVVVVNNPFSQFIDLRLAREAKQLKLQLFNISGLLVHQTE
ncbi:MAG: hypothetical protein ACXWB9_02775, partial [Flavisolibacter sp.]